MDRANNETPNHIKLAYILFRVAPELIIKHIDRTYPGGIEHAIKGNKEVLKQRLSTDGFRRLCQIEVQLKHDIHSNYHELVNNTILDGSVLDWLISKGVISIDEREKVKKCPNQSARNTMIIDLLMNRSYNVRETLIDALHTSGHENNDLLDRMMDTKVYNKVEKLKEAEINEWSIRLEKNYFMLVQQTTSVESVVDRLISTGVLSIDDSSDIMSIANQSDQVRELIGKIRDQTTYEHFLCALRQDEVNDQLADILEATEVFEEEKRSRIAAILDCPIFKAISIDIATVMYTVIQDIKSQNTQLDMHDNSVDDDLETLQHYCNYIIDVQEIGDEQYDEILKKVSDIIERICDSPKELCFKVGLLEHLGTEVINELHNVLQNMKDNAVIQSLQMKIKDMEEEGKASIPKNVRLTQVKAIEQWIHYDKTFAETKVSEEVVAAIKNHSCVTIIGSPGSGKTATSQHVALIYRKQGYQLVPIDTPEQIITYGDPNKKQIFVYDDILGVFGVDHDKVDKLERKREMLMLVLENDSKLIMTCRKSVFKATEMLCTFQSTKVFFLKNIVDLESKQFCISENEKRCILKMHCSAVGINPNKYTSWSFESANIMFPLLCRLFANEKQYQDIGLRFFNEPHECLYEKLDEMKCRSKIHYAALVLCMINKGKLSEDDFPDKKVKQLIYRTCRLNDGTPELDLIDALDHMLETYVTQCDGVFRFIHDCIFEVTASHFGNQYPNLIIEYLDSNYIAHKVRVISEELSQCMHVKVLEKDYSSLGNRIYRDITNMELFDVFMNNSLNYEPFRIYFLEMLRKKTYEEIKELFLSIQTDSISTHIVNQGDNVIEKVMNKDKFRDSFVLRSQDILLDKIVQTDNSVIYQIRVLSWIIYYRHALLLEFIIALVLSNNESTDIIFGTSETEQIRLLILACFSGDFDMLRLIQNHVNSDCINRALLPIDAGWPEKKKNPHRCKTPLSAACLRGDLASIEELLKLGADVNMPDSAYLLPILAAAYSCHWDAMDLLIKHNADINKGNHSGTPPLILAATVGHTEAILQLLKRGATVNLCKNDGTSAIHRASDRGHLEVLRILVQEGGDINVCNNDGESPLFIASENGHLEIVKYLLQTDANVNFSNNSSKSPLFAACTNNHLAVVTELLENNAHVDCVDKNNRTPLYIASRKGRVKLIRTLYKYGASPNICDNHGRSPLSIATTNGHSEALKVLLNNGAHVNLPDVNNFSPLFLASGNTDLQELLLQYGADKTIKPYLNYLIRTHINGCRKYYLVFVGLILTLLACLIIFS
ncbi:Hypothetical predicted protein [Mytilus galloprovincialis]|uniref:CARD domain-containing protein n=1 Tax=Mytilus galloprovincialis TaxID=29158 RepID=A0A8B6C9K5_MYTGA|nr:Hypothetical predicted protein [Mytilus galloprovincialis]